jgi:integrase
LKNRIPAKAVQKMHGHSTISMTLDTYSHVLPETQAQAAESLDDLLGRDK